MVKSSLELAPAALAAAFGALTGLSEILSRYRDEPIKASFNRYGFTYLAFNAIISFLAYLLLVRYAVQLFPAIAGDWLLRAIVAGFGAMVVMRSKLFTFSASDGQEYAIGPSIVVDTIVKTIDQKIDRKRAADRQKKVCEHLQEVGDFDRAAQYLQASLLSFQQLTESQKRDIAAVVSEYKGSDWDHRLKVMALGFAFLTVAGEENFTQVVANLKAFLSVPSAVPAVPETGREPADDKPT